MATKRKPRDKSLDDRGEDATIPDHGEGAKLAAVDQREAEDNAIDEEVAKHQAEIDRQAPPTTQPVPPRKNVVAFRVFEQVSPLKLDQLAGFKSHVKRTNLGPMSIEEWKLAHSEFMGKPVK